MAAENETNTKVDNFQLHEELGKQYAIKHEKLKSMGVKSIWELVRKYNAPRIYLPRKRVPNRKRRK